MWYQLQASPIFSGAENHRKGAYTRAAPSFASDSSQMICEAVILSLRGPAASSHPRLQIFLLFFRRNARGPALVGPNAGYQTLDTISEALYEYEFL